MHTNENISILYYLHVPQAQITFIVPFITMHYHYMCIIIWNLKTHTTSKNSGQYVNDFADIYSLLCTNASRICLEYDMTDTRALLFLIE